MKIFLKPGFALSSLTILFVANGCNTSQAPVASQTNVAQQTTTATSVPAPDPDQIAFQNYRQAASACETEFAFAIGSLSRRLNCNIQAEQQNVPPSWTDGQKAILARFDKYILQAASLVDEHSMSMQAFAVYNSYARQIEEREENAVAQEDDRLSPDTNGRFELSYDWQQGNQQAIEADEHNIAVWNLGNQMQTVSDDRDEYVYCAGLYRTHLDACAPEKLAFESDLSMYQTMAASIPNVEQQESPAQAPAQTLQQQDIQDDLDAIAGGVVP